MCDRDDVGGIAYSHHPQVGKGAIFIYDGYPGGVGLAERAFDVQERLLEAALKLISLCSCEAGCPSCIHSPKCGSGNKPLDKAGAQFVLEALLGKVPLETARTANGEEVSVSSPEKPVAEEPPPLRVVFLDIETQRSAEEVGGWSHAHLMGLALAVICETQYRLMARSHAGPGGCEEPQEGARFCTYFESDLEALLEALKRADLVVGFNVIRFDFSVLRGYTHFDFKKLHTFDILEDVQRRLGYRLSLDHLSRTTLGVGKEADGLQSLQWFKEGRLDLVEKYCRRDVEITRNLFQFGQANGYLLFQQKNGHVLRLPVDWDVAKLTRNR
jgi:DEAD/DEAH box helicase domain-containing protein